MKQLFKTTLLATAVAVTCGTAYAGTVSVTNQVHSSEGLLGVTADQTSNAISYTLGAGYLVGDKITFTFPDGALAAAPGFLSTINVPAVNSDTPASALAGLALGLSGDTANSVTYRVLTVSQPSTVTVDPVTGNVTPYTDRSSLGQVVNLGTAKYKAAAVAAGAVTVTVDSQDASGAVLDNVGTRTAKVAEAKSQFGSVTVTDAFDAIIDVGAMRQAFVGSTTDSMSYIVTNPDTTGWSNVATVTASSAILKGEAGKMTDVVDTQWASGGTNTFNATAATLSVAYTGMTTNDTITFTPTTGNAAKVIETQVFATDFAYSYTSAAATTSSATVASNVVSGEWKLNGATVNIPYMPYSPNASQILYVSNSGSQAGDISVTAFDDKGKTYDLGVIGQAGAKSITKIAQLVGPALLTQGFTSGKVSLTVTVNAPEADITVYASYNIGGADRGYVNTDQYKGK